MKKAVKGRFGYIKAKRWQTSVRTLLYFGISLALFLAGFLSTGKKENLLTIVAVLGCLPASKSLVNTIMFFRAMGCSQKVRDAVAPLEGRLVGMYDMYFTSYQKNFAISHMVVDQKVVLGYSESGCDVRACEEHLQNMLRQGGFRDLTVTISDQLQKYCQQLQNLNELNPEPFKKEDEVRAALYEISL